jgi:hypothetical protein
MGMGLLACEGESSVSTALASARSVDRVSDASDDRDGGRSDDDR